MPKTNIHHRFAHETGDYVPFLELGWDRAGFVHVAALAGGDYDEPNHPRPGYSVQLDRSGINRLIRDLRKARDQAFGADA